MNALQFVTVGEYEQERATEVHLINVSVKMVRNYRFHIFYKTMIILSNICIFRVG